MRIRILNGNSSSTSSANSKRDESFKHQRVNDCSVYPPLSSIRVAIVFCRQTQNKRTRNSCCGTVCDARLSNCDISNKFEFPACAAVGRFAPRRKKERKKRPRES